MKRPNLVGKLTHPFIILTGLSGSGKSQAIRALDIVSEQTRALRRRALMQSFQQTHESGLEKAEAPAKGGSYWGITTRIDAYGVSDALAKDNATTASMQHIRTRLAEFKPDEQARLINWGYALTDAAMRRYVDPDNRSIGRLPVPAFPL